MLELPTQAYPAGGGLHGGVQWLGRPGRMINTASGAVDSWIHPEVAASSHDHDADPATPDRPWPDVYRRYATSVRRIDDSIADLVQLLSDLKLDENTLVVFSSDNGPAAESYLTEEYTPQFFSSYGPFAGIKRDLLEGGLRVPAIVRWPGRVPAGRIVPQPSAHWDWLPTFAEIAGLPPPARADGISLLPALTGQGVARARDLLYFEYNIAGRTPDYPAFNPQHRNRLRGQMQAVRLGDLMGVRYDVESADDDFEIYQVVSDPKQSRNLAREPGFEAIQRRMKAGAAQARRPDRAAPRPYDDILVPAGAPTAAALAPGVVWRAYAGPFPWTPDFAALTPVAHGAAPRPDPARTGRSAASGLSFAGNLIVPADGEYTFHLTTNTGAALRLHEALLIDADYGYIAGTERSTTIRLQAGLHPFRLAYIRAETNSPVLQLEWSGPGLARQPVPDEAFSRLP